MSRGSAICRRGICAVCVVAASAVATSHAYNSGRTHPELTGQALLSSDLHRFLRNYGLSLGLFDKLQVLPSSMAPRQLQQLRRDLDRLDPAGGFRPSRLEQWGLGWVMSGAGWSGLRPWRSRSLRLACCPCPKSSRYSSPPRSWPRSSRRCFWARRSVFIEWRRSFLVLLAFR